MVRCNHARYNYKIYLKQLFAFLDTKVDNDNSFQVAYLEMAIYHIFFGYTFSGLPAKV